MATPKTAMSTKAKVITAIIYLLAVALLATVIYMNLNSDPEKDSKLNVNKNVSATQSVDELDLPYNAQGSDKYANIEPLYSVSDISLEEDGNNILSAFKDGKKVKDYTGVAKGDDGWFFVRDGEVDFHYTGIAANEKGNWYIKEGKVDFGYDGDFTVNNTTYTITGGRATVND